MLEVTLFPNPDTEKRLDTVLKEMPGLFFQSLPAGKRAFQIDAGFKDPNPDDLIGQAFCWEKSPDDRIQQGDGGGIDRSEIENLNKRGYDAMKEGAGLDYLLPTALLRVNRNIPRYEYLDSENRNFPYWGACFTLPRLLTDPPSSSDTPCFFNFPHIEEDEFDAVQRNDSLSSATKIEWKSYQNLSIDKTTHSYYYSPVVYVKHSLRERIPANIAPEQDRDYYYLENDEGYGVHVTVESPPNTVIMAFVDGMEAMPMNGDHHRKTVLVPSRNRHTIIVTSPIMTTQYSMSIKSLPIAGDQSVSTYLNTPVEIVLTGRDREGSPLTYTVTTGPGGTTAHGRVSGTPPRLIYTPNTDYVGEDSFSFTVNNGISDSDVANVSITILREEFLKRWTFSLHSGAAVPAGAMADSYDRSFNVAADLDYNINPKISLLAGYNNFKDKINGNFYWLNLSINARYYYLPARGRSKYLAFVGAGPGVYIPKSGNSQKGINASAGIEFLITSNFSAAVGGNYHVISGDDTKFFNVHAGLVFKF